MDHAREGALLGEPAMKELLLIGVGGFLGANVRYLMAPDARVDLARRRRLQ